VHYGYRALFWDDDAGRPKVFRHDGLEVRVRLLLYTEDANRAPEMYRPYWFDDPEEIANTL